LIQNSNPASAGEKGKTLLPDQDIPVSNNGLHSGKLFILP
jgi:hypothetical protein